MASPSNDLKSGWSYKKSILFCCSSDIWMRPPLHRPVLVMGRLARGGEPGTVSTELTGQGGHGAGAAVKIIWARLASPRRVGVYGSHLGSVWSLEPGLVQEPGL